MAKLTVEEREILINALVENGAIEEDEVETFEGMKDARLISFADVALNSADDEEDDEDDEELEEDEDIVDNSDEEDAEDDDEDFEDEEEDEEDEDDETPATNSHVCNTCAGKGGKKKKKGEAVMNRGQQPMTTEEWMANAPPEVAMIVQNALSHTNNEKAKLIDSMTTNLSGDAKKAAIRVLANNSLEELKVLAPGMTQPAAPSVTINSLPGLHRRSFAGAGGPPTNNSNGKGERKSEPLIMPTINWAEASKEFANSSN